MKTAVIYARYSSERQNDQSIEGQLRICNKYAQDNNLMIVDTYIDRATTGLNDQRPAFQQMLADSAKPVPWDIVLVYAIDRFGRNSIEIAVNKQKLKKNKKTLISATQRTSENIDGSKNLDGILLENMYIGLAEYYSAELSQKVRRGLNENRQKGLFCGGALAFGYRVQNKKVIVEPNEATIILDIYRQYAEGKIAKEIIANLAARGLTYRGKPFAMNTFYGILRKEQYIGVHHHDGEIYTNIYPPIVPKLLFDRVQAILAKNKIGSRSNLTEYLLRDRAFCGYCGKTLQGESGTARNGTVKHYYKCMGRKKFHTCSKSVVPKDKLEELIISETFRAFSPKESIEEVAELLFNFHVKKLQDQSILNILTAERDNIKKSLSNIMKAIEQGIFNETTKSRMEELEEQLAETENKILIEEYKTETQLKREQVIEFLTHSLRQRPKLLIQTFVKKVILWDDKIEIHFNFSDKTYPDENSHRDCLELTGSDSSRLVRMKGLEPIWSPTGT